MSPHRPSDCHILLISDIHLGARVCRARKVLDTLDSIKFKTLIINGDLFDTDTTHHLTPDHWEVIDRLSSIAKERDVIMVGGNHGRALDSFVRKLGIKIREDYAFSVGKSRFLCLHGDQFDVWAREMPLTNSFFTALYELLQGFGGDQQRISMLVKRFSKRFLRVQAKQEKLALAHAANQGASVVICSHTHLPYENDQNGIHFINSGSFCDAPCSYIVIDRHGKAELREI